MALPRTPQTVAWLTRNDHYDFHGKREQFKLKVGLLLNARFWNYLLTCLGFTRTESRVEDGSKDIMALRPAYTVKQCALSFLIKTKRSHALAC
ncbi:uncharacterized protein FOMMEDRAFT_142781 [Fomitiporia mediterranea MF3/22]|uniref:uncharacterized protein n=1 Tax=Fomitiporia mediterranea (strain MF3/22) TaxID=694068 RepID=UPI000440740F|nr:uncharacterized protein FOMMEDRAFT_142781 [Fomitiporia mediterranea MF3/22]EJC99119.1 hypothetical protein FOMMEDRAFT_142781 [Fomitiporia mediterranea MF3/22]